MEKVKWGIIGCGNVTEVKSGPAFSKVEGSELSAVMRRNAALAADYAARHNVPRWYSEADALLNDPGVNAIYIATPPSTHEFYALRALEAGKPVYLEKPMAIDSASAERISVMAAEKNIPLSVAHYRRQQPVFLKIKSLLEEQAIGRVKHVGLLLEQPAGSEIIAATEENWRTDPAISGGGLFHDLAPHQLDLMLYFFGKPVRSTGISCNTGKLYEADDTVSGQVLFSEEILFTGSWSFVAEASRDLCVITGTEGSISFSIFEQHPVQLLREGKQQRFHFDPLPHVQQPMIEAVVRYFLGNGPNPCSADEGVAVMQVIDSFTRKQAEL
jgi:predicted dehydrogenase